MWPVSMAMAWMKTASEGLELATDAQRVVILRLMGLSGLRPSPSDEGLRMILEKPPVFLAAGLAWHRSVLSGGDWHAQTRAATRPLARKTRANRRRLSTR